MRKKKWYTLALSGLLITGLLAGCGGGNQAPEAEETAPPQETASEQAENKTIIIGATPTPHEEILTAMKEAFEEEGYTLDIRPFSDYVQPNKALDAGELDANYFQHLPYLEDFNAENDMGLVSAGAIHYEPMALFGGRVMDLDNLPDGARIAVPNDTTNEARALLLLQENGLITLKEGADLHATKNDIEDNPQNLDIVELEAAQIPRSLGDVDMAVINGNYALLADLLLENAIALEARDSLAAQTYANIIAVREEDKDSEKTKVLIKVLTSDACRQYIEDNYQGSVLPV